MCAFRPANPLINAPADGQTLDTLEGTIERITFHNAENGYTVARLLPPGARDVITILGNFSNPVVGESLVCYGTWTHHPQWGRQMQVARYEVVRPATAFAIEKYLGSGMIKGIGPVMAKRIVDKFGEEALDIIEHKPQKLRQIHGIGDKKLDRIKQAWQDQREVKNIMLFLQSHGVSPAYAVKIYKTYGSKAIEVVEKNPYQLAADIYGIGFKSADKIARALGIAEDDPRRIQAGVVYVLNEAVETGGNAYLTEDELTRKANEILGMEDIAPAIDALAFSGRLVLEPAEFLGQTETAIYPPSLYTTERNLAERLLRLLSQPIEPASPAKFDAWLTALVEKRRQPLSDEQREAVKLALTSRFTILTGGPGTGKTTTTNTIVAAFEALKKNVLLASPTGRAAKRLAEVTQRDARTVHRLLEFDPEQRGFKHNAENPLECDVLIVDECSMLDMVLTYSLLKAVPDGSQVVFVGDVDQLPSVGPGNVLRDLIDSGRAPVARLTQVFRQAAQSLIITNAHAINAGRFPQLPPPSAFKDCAWLDAEEAEEVADKVIAVVAVSLPKRGYPPGDIQVLTPMQRGSAGAAFLNQRLQEVLNPPADDRPEVQRGSRLFRVGDRVMQMTNNYDKGVYNGDIGVVAAINHEDDTLAVHFTDAQGSTEVTYDFADMDELTLAYSCSIHKCIAAEERVHTRDRGLVAIKDLQAGDYVYTGEHVAKPVLDKIATGRKPVLRITTRMGYRIDVSQDHPLLASDGGPPQFVTAKEVKEGIHLCLSRHVVDPQVPILLPRVSSELGRQTLHLPTHLDEDLAWFLGATVGDGSYRDMKDGTVDFTNQDQEVLCKYRAVLEGYNLRVCTSRPVTRSAIRLRVVSKAFRDWLCRLGLGYSTANDKRIPEIIFQASALVKGAFLRGLFDTDGGASGNSNTCRLITSSFSLAREVQALLLSLGIVSGIARWMERAYCVGVSGPSLPEFAERVGFTVGYKRERLHSFVQISLRRGKANVDTVPFSPHLIAEASECLRQHFGNSRGIKGKGLYANGNCRIGAIFQKVRLFGSPLTYWDINALFGHLQQIGASIPASLSETANRRYLYDRVVCVERLSEETEMYDIEVEGIHSFVANGFICHNSQGSEYPVVVLALHTQHYMLLQRNLLYTALTRARKFAVLIGPQRAIALAVKKQSDIHRHTRLKERLQGTL
ncbi:MAG: ATP-dependent RecD-like DNA helicase [Armatimonadetes bacterium]|nr:ATP-dependent RecD-like DNA helicase [Armatimonadota bacterium]